MSTLEKAISLLESMPEDQIETVYTFIQFVDSRKNEGMNNTLPRQNADARSILGIAHEYANTALINQEEDAFERSMAQKELQKSFIEALKSDRFVIPTDLGNNADRYIEGLRKDDRI